MSIPVSGPLSFDQLNTELNKSSTAQLSFNDVDFSSMTIGYNPGPIQARSLSAIYGKTYNGLYYYPLGGFSDQLTVTASISVRGARSTTIYVGGNGTMTYAVSSQMTTDVGWVPQRWITPSSTNIGNSYDFRWLQTGWTRSGTATNDLWGWTVNSNIFGSPSGGNFSTDWMTTTNGFTVSFAQQRVTPDGSFDATASGTLDIRAKANPSVVSSIPFAIRIYAA
jgi:hypothetical protein